MQLSAGQQSIRRMYMVLVALLVIEMLLTTLGVSAYFLWLLDRVRHATWVDMGVKMYGHVHVWNTCNHAAEIPLFKCLAQAIPFVRHPPPFHSMQVARSRTVLFAVFLFIPGGLIRSLSKKTTDVGDNESECNLQHVPITTVWSCPPRTDEPDLLIYCQVRMTMSLRMLRTTETTRACENPDLRVSNSRVIQRPVHDDPSKH